MCSAVTCQMVTCTTCGHVQSVVACQSFGREFGRQFLGVIGRWGPCERLCARGCFRRCLGELTIIKQTYLCVMFKSNLAGPPPAGNNGHSD